MSDVVKVSVGRPSNVTAISYQMWSRQFIEATLELGATNPGPDIEAIPDDWIVETVEVNHGDDGYPFPEITVTIAPRVDVRARRDPGDAER